MTGADNVLFRATWEAAALAERFPPAFSHPNKRLVQGIACPPGSTARGTVTVSRWSEIPLPERVPGGFAHAARPNLVESPGYFSYDPPAAGTIAWHQNFADPLLFGFFAGGLFAQDEMQVTEHPALASVPAALKEAGVPPFTEQDGAPTPVLVAGVERRVAVDTEPGLEHGRIQGLYGNRFGSAAPDVIRSATRRIDPPTQSNIVAIAALRGSSGRPYSRVEIVRTLSTAFSGYRAAVIESAALAPEAAVVLHTGFWGCGAFGGDRVLMTVLQTLAAQLAGADTLVMHLGDSTGKRSVTEARRLLSAIGEGMTLSDLLDQLVARGFVWGQSDGN